MFKNISRHIFLSLCTAIVSSLLVLFIFKNPFNWTSDSLLIAGSIIIYIFFLLGLFATGFKNGSEELLILAAIIPFVSFLSLGGSYAFDLMGVGNLVLKAICCWLAVCAIIIWFIFLINKPGINLFSFLLLLNVLFTVFVYLPYGLPRITYSANYWGSWESTHFVTLPLVSLNNYRPFTKANSDGVSFVFLIRMISSGIFFFYEIWLTFAEIITQKEVSKPLPPFKNELSLLQFLQTLIYFFWCIIEKLVYASSNFFVELYQNIMWQVKKSLSFLVSAILLIVPFIIPVLITKLNYAEFVHLLNPAIKFPDFNQLHIILYILVLGLIPIFLCILIKLKEKDFRDELYGPDLYLPLFIMLFSLGLSSIASYFIVHRAGYYMYIFIAILIYTITWGLLKKSKNML